MLPALLVTVPAWCPWAQHAALAQSVERLTRNEKVVGSIPTGGSTPPAARGTAAGRSRLVLGSRKQPCPARARWRSAWVATSSGGSRSYLPNYLQRWWASVGSFVWCATGDSGTPDEGATAPRERWPGLRRTSSSPVPATPWNGPLEERCRNVVEAPRSGDDTRNGHTEVVLAFQTDAAGARVRFWCVNRRVGDDRFTHRVGWVRTFRGGCGRSGAAAVPEVPTLPADPAHLTADGRLRSCPGRNRRTPHRSRPAPGRPPGVARMGAWSPSHL